jgi:hypothetical protein
MEARLIKFWWHNLPLLAGKISIFISVILTDGLYLTRWSKLAAYAPVVSLLTGFFIGWKHFSTGDVFTFSITVMAVMMAISSFGSGLGSWLLLGYSFGDFFLFPHPRSNDFYESFFLQQIPLLLSYTLLSILLVSIPLTTQSLRLQTIPRLKNLGAFGLVVEAILQAGIQSSLVFVWTQSVPLLIRPVYTWQGGTPPVEAIQPLQNDWLILVQLAAILGVIRIFLEFKSLSDPFVIERGQRLKEELQNIKPYRISIPPYIIVIAKAAFTTAMLSGMITIKTDIYLLGGTITLAMLIRDSSFKQLTGWTTIVFKIPILLRLILATGLSYYLALTIIDFMWQDNSFSALLISTMVGIIVFGLLMPNPKAEPLKEESH